MNVRAGHHDSHRPDVWLGNQGPVRGRGVADIIDRIATKAACRTFIRTNSGIPGPNSNLADGMNEGDLMRLAGWKSRAMVN